jgi:hypothetical protein
MLKYKKGIQIELNMQENWLRIQAENDVNMKNKYI